MNGRWVRFTPSASCWIARTRGSLSPAANAERQSRWKHHASTTDRETADGRRTHKSVYRLSESIEWAQFETVFRARATNRFHPIHLTY